MNKIRSVLCTLTFSAVINACYADVSACTAKSAADLYSPIFLDKSVAIRFKVSSISLDPSVEIFPIAIVGQNCETGSETQVAELPYLGDPGEVESAFLADSDFDGKAELFVIHRAIIYSDIGISYGSDYFTTVVYRRLSPLTYERDDRISSYFGAGGDVLLSPASDELIYEYPYKSKSAIQNRLASPQYKAWLEQKPISTRILNKTYLYTQANVAGKSSNYLIAEDEIRVTDQKAGWLEVVFHNKKKGDVKGWVQCKDTHACSMSNIKINKILRE